MSAWTSEGRQMSNGKRFALILLSTLVTFGSALMPAAAQSSEDQPRWMTLVELRDQGAIFPAGSLTTSEKFWLAIGLQKDVRAARGLALNTAEKVAVRSTFSQSLSASEAALMGL
jgi:hypothetical protein